MIIQLKPGQEDSKEVAALCAAHHTTTIRFGDRVLVVTSSAVKTLDKKYAALAEKVYAFDNDIQLAHTSFRPKTEITLGDVAINAKNTLLITGPCSVESEEQIRTVAEFLKDQGVKVMRAGAYKPRTSPYTFQGMGQEGLKLLRRISDEYGLKLITEARDASHIDQVIAAADIVQIGTKAMYDTGILRACGQMDKPVLLKRSFGATLQEFVQAAEFILSGGNTKVILCERGIRTFENKTRFTLDLCGVAFLKEHTHLPVFVDPSHAMGHAYGIPDLTRAAVAMGVEGLLIETHPDPPNAKSDAAQQLNFAQLKALQASAQQVATAVGRTII